MIKSSLCQGELQCYWQFYFWRSASSVSGNMWVICSTTYRKGKHFYCLPVEFGYIILTEDISHCLVRYLQCFKQFSRIKFIDQKIKLKTRTFVCWSFVVLFVCLFVDRNSSCLNSVANYILNNISYAAT